MRFTIIEENTDELVESVTDYSGIPAEDARELVSSLAELSSEDVEVAMTLEYGCALVRIFEYGEYLFLYPIELTVDADVERAIGALADYAALEELRLTLADTPRDALPTIFDMGFRHVDIDAQDAEAESYRVRLKTECELLTSAPCLSGDKLTISELTREDESAYAALCREESGLEFWGYDYREDNPDPADAYFIEVAREERSVGASLTLAARLDGKLIGECVFYAFDRRGGAEFAFRLLPEYRGRGLGAELYSLAVSAAERIGLLRLYGRVMKRNTPCLSLIDKRMTRTGENDDVCEYTLELYE